MNKLKDVFNKLKNPGTIVALVGLVGIILHQFSIDVNMEKVTSITLAICSILVILGVLNNPNTPGLDLPFFNEEENSIELEEKNSKDKK